MKSPPLLLTTFSLGRRSTGLGVKTGRRPTGWPGQAPCPLCALAFQLPVHGTRSPTTVQCRQELGHTVQERVVETGLSSPRHLQSPIREFALLISAALGFIK